MGRRLLVMVLVLAVATSGWLTGYGNAQMGDQELEAGIRQVQEGDFDNGLLTLDGVAKRLSAKGGEPRALARAYVYLAIAHRGLGQELTAKAKYREALRVDPGLKLNPKEFPPAILQFFEQSKREAGPPASPPPQKAAAEPKKRGSRLPLVLVGVGGAAAAGIALAARGASPSPSPSGPPAVVEVLAVPGDGSTVVSRTVLDVGVRFTLRASGTMFIGGAGLADAEFNFNESLTTVLDLCAVAPVDVGIGVNDTVNDNRKSPTWGTFTATHIYTVEFTGLGAPIRLTFHDCAFADNQGSLTVEIIR